jgi:oligopeptide/dipeptide ABC transporter ATP-binding protein
VNLLELEKVTLEVASPAGPRPILRDVSLTIAAGEAVGLVGESGSGKSMTLRAILGAEPDGAKVGGHILFDDVDLRKISGRQLRRLRGEGIGVVGQDPKATMNPVRTVEAFLLEGLVDVLGQLRGAARQRICGLLETVGLTDPDRVLSSYPHQLSGGMLQRVAIAAALSGRPRLLLADEPTTALDVTTQSEVMAIVDELRRDEGLAMVFVTHDLELAGAVCDRIAVMYAGEIIEVATPEQVHATPHHPYSRLLLDARPSIDTAVELLPVIPGRPAAAHETGQGCAFAPRCPWAQDECRRRSQSLTSDGQRQVRCWRSKEIAQELARPLTEVHHD